MTALLQSKFVRVLTLILLAQAALFYAASRGESAPMAAPLAKFPSVVGPWTLAQEGIIEKDELDILKADDTLTRWYVNPASRGGANLFIAFFRTQRTGQSPHSPKNCLPGSGWQPSESGRIDVAIPGAAGQSDSIHINRYVVAKGDNQSLVLYWYQSQGRVIADEFAAKFYLIEDSIRKHRSDTALVRVVVPIPPGHAADADAVGTEFVQSMYPVVRNYLPR
jgi:EpsI family protein